TTSTTLPPQPVVESVAELPGRAVSVQFWDGSSFVALSHVDAPLGAGESVVRLDDVGAVTQEASVPGAWSLFAAARAGEQWFVSTYDGTTCGVQPLDLSTLTLGPVITVPMDHGCSGRLVVDGADPGVLLVADATRRAYFRIDTRSGAAGRVDVAAAVPDR